MSCSKLREWTVHWGKCPAACIWQSGVYTCMVPSSKYPPFLYRKWSRGSSSNHMTYYMSGKKVLSFSLKPSETQAALGQGGTGLRCFTAGSTKHCPCHVEEMYVYRIPNLCQYVCIYIYTYIHIIHIPYIHIQYHAMSSLISVTTTCMT